MNPKETIMGTYLKGAIKGDPKRAIPGELPKGSQTIPRKTCPAVVSPLSTSAFLDCGDLDFRTSTSYKSCTDLVSPRSCWLLGLAVFQGWTGHALDASISLLRILENTNIIKSTNLFFSKSWKTPTLAYYKTSLIRILENTNTPNHQTSSPHILWKHQH